MNAFCQEPAASELLQSICPPKSFGKSEKGEVLSSPKATAATEVPKNRESVAIVDQAKGSASNADTGPVVVISDPWIRSAPPNAMALAGYATIRNNSDQNISIVGVKSPFFKMSMIKSYSNMRNLGEYSLKSS